MELARRASIAPTSVVRLENGEIERPRISTLTKLASALGVKPAELVRSVSDIHRPSLGQTAARDVGAFTAIFEPIEDGWYLARCVELPEAITQGRTLDEAREMLRDAVGLILEDNRDLAEREVSGKEGVIREPLAL